MPNWPSPSHWKNSLTRSGPFRLFVPWPLHWGHSNFSKAMLVSMTFQLMSHLMTNWCLQALGSCVEQDQEYYSSGVTDFKPWSLSWNIGSIIPCLSYRNNHTVSHRYDVMVAPPPPNTVGNMKLVQAISWAMQTYTLTCSVCVKIRHGLSISSFTETWPPSSMHAPYKNIVIIGLKQRHSKFFKPNTTARFASGHFINLLSVNITDAFDEQLIDCKEHLKIVGL